jgi:hypothetical protein
MTQESVNLFTTAAVQLRSFVVHSSNVAIRVRGIIGLFGICSDTSK